MRNISFWKRRELLSRSVLKEILQEGKRKRIIKVRLTARVGAVAMDKDTQAWEKELCGNITKGRRYKKNS